MRQEKTLKIRGNHVIMPGTKVQEHSGSEKAVVFNCVDFADEVQKPELFCLRFASAERAKEFKEGYEAAASRNEPLLSGVNEETGDGREEEEVAKVTEELGEKAALASKDEEN
jgi:Ran-binding protein 1